MNVNKFLLKMVFFHFNLDLSKSDFEMNKEIQSSLNFFYFTALLFFASGMYVQDFKFAFIAGAIAMFFLIAGVNCVNEIKANKDKANKD